MRTILLVTLLTIGCALTGLAQSPAPAPVQTGSWGTVKDSKFISERLKLTIPLPPSYTVLSTADIDVLSRAGVDMIKQESSRDKEIDEAVVRSIRLIAIAEKPPGTLNNSALEMVAAKQADGVTASMSLAANLMLLKGSPYKLSRSLGTIKLGGNSFSAAEMDVTLNNVTFKQRMYVIMHRGFAITAAATYFTDDQRRALEEILGGLAFTK